MVGTPPPVADQLEPMHIHLQMFSAGTTLFTTLMMILVLSTAHVIQLGMIAPHLTSQVLILFVAIC